MFTGNRPTDGMFKDGLNLHNFAKMASPAEVLDPVLLTEAEETSGDSGNHMECLAGIVKVGVACSAESPRERII